MNICISCGMPMQTKSDYPKGDTGKTYCVHCARPDGSMQSFEEKRDAMIRLLIKTQGFDERSAEKIAESSMKKLPAWKKYFE